MLSGLLCDDLKARNAKKKMKCKIIWMTVEGNAMLCKAMLHMHTTKFG